MMINSQQLPVLLILAGLRLAAALIPASPEQQTRRAIASLKTAISVAKEQNKECRFYVDYLIPLPPATKAGE